MNGKPELKKAVRLYCLSGNSTCRLRPEVLGKSRSSASIIAGETTLISPLCPTLTWFGGLHPVELREEVIGLGNYGKTLTVLTSDTFADEEEEEQDLEESWRPKWR